MPTAARGVDNSGLEAQKDPLNEPLGSSSFETSRYNVNVGPLRSPQVPGNTLGGRYRVRVRIFPERLRANQD